MAPLGKWNRQGNFSQLGKIIASCGGSTVEVTSYSEAVGANCVDTFRKLVIIAVVGKIGNPLEIESAPIARGTALRPGSHLRGTWMLPLLDGRNALSALKERNGQEADQGRSRSWTPDPQGVTDHTRATGRAPVRNG
jgi:hypothetical protein